MSAELVNRLAADIREVDGDHKLGAAELAEALVEKGWTQSPAKKADVPLKDYSYGDPVEVWFRGEWLPGQVSEATRGARQIMSVHLQDKGPVTVAHSGNIRRVKK